MYCYASSERQAKLIFINRLSKLLDRSPWSLNGLYNNYLDNYSVTLETEFTEIGETADEHLCEYYCCMRKKECDGKGNIEFTKIKKPLTKGGNLMKKLLLALIVFGFIVSTSYAWDPNQHKNGPGFTPRTQQEENRQQWQRQRQQQNWDSMQRQQESYEIQRKIDSQKLNDDFDRIDREK